MNIRKISQNELDDVILMIMNNIPIKRIAKILKVSTASIYYHFPNVKRKKFNPIVIQSDDEELIGEFIGVFAGDGNFYMDNNWEYKISLYFNIKETKYINSLQTELFKLFGRLPMQKIESNKIILKWYSKNIYLFIKKYLDWDDNGRKSHSVHLKKGDYSREFKIGFIRGSLDSDGYFSDNEIMFASSSKMLIENIKSFLEDIGISYHYHEYEEKRSNRVNMHHVHIRKPNRLRFIELINPRERKNIKNAPAEI